MQYVKKICILLLEQSILLPALKLGIETDNHELQILAMERIKAVDQVRIFNSKSLKSHSW